MKLNPNIDLPPVAQILSSEDILEINSAPSLANKFQKEGLLDELKRQADWTIDKFEYSDRRENLNHGDFLFTASGSLDPFSPLGKCSSEACRIAETDDFINSVGLYSDGAYIIDPFTYPLHADVIDLDKFFNDLYIKLKIYKKLLPMIQAGILQFRAPVRRFCQDCHDREKDLIKTIAMNLSDAAKDDFISENSNYKW